MPVSTCGFTLLYVIFLVVGAAERLKYTFASKSKPAKGGQIYYGWTFFVLAVVYALIVLLSIAEYFLIVKSVNWYVTTIGFLVFASGVYLRIKSGMALGRNWSFHIEIKDGQELVTSGIYRYFKHPYYLAVILELAGVCMIANAFYSFLLVFILQLPLLVMRISLEEKILLGHFSDRYKQYSLGKLL